jgi:hypothetical protein
MPARRGLKSQNTIQKSVTTNNARLKRKNTVVNKYKTILNMDKIPAKIRKCLYNTPAAVLLFHKKNNMIFGIIIMASIYNIRSIITPFVLSVFIVPPSLVAS